MAANSPVILPVTVVTARARSAYEVERHYVGGVVSRRLSNLGFDRDGRIEEVVVETGDKVKKGELLASLDMRHLQARVRTFQAELTQARANRDEARAKFRLAKLTVERKRRLRERDNVSAQQYDEAEYDVKVRSSQLTAAAAAIQRVEATLRELEVQLSQSYMRAPFSGVILLRRASEGAAVEAGEAVLQLMDDNALEARIGVPSHVADRLVTGETYDLKIEGRGYRVPLRTVVASINLDTRTQSAIFPLDGAGTSVRPGQLVRLTVRQRVTADGFWLPIAALAESRRGLWSAFVVEPTDYGSNAMRVTRRELNIVHAESERVFVRGTLHDGDRVVATGIHRLVPGQFVRIR